jgi:DENN domain-containing protein 11
MLEEYWEKNRVREGSNAEKQDGGSPVLESRPTSSAKPNGYSRQRAISDATALMTSHQTLSPHHPAISLPKFITDFGPLVFPLYRAALLRKRILIVGEPPVERNCDFGTVI